MAKKKAAPAAKSRKAATQDTGKIVPIFRVWKLDADLKSEMAEKRQQLGQTVRDFVRDSVATKLPALTANLASLGIIASQAESVTPVRIPMDDATIQDLRNASQLSGLDQSHLLIACLRLTSQQGRRKRGQKSE
ncbi:MAG: hypothetical protein ACK50J_29400 [Planctomyces sp.]